MELTLVQYATIGEYSQLFPNIEDSVSDAQLQNASEYINDLIWPNRIKEQTDTELYSKNVKLATIYQANYTLINFNGNDPGMEQTAATGFSLGDLSINAPNTMTGSNTSQAQLMNKTCQKALHYLKKEGLLYNGITINKTLS